jgi:hypothetical protein
MDGWVGGWMDGWVGVKAFLRIAYSNQKEQDCWHLAVEREMRLKETNK